MRKLLMCPTCKIERYVSPQSYCDYRKGRSLGRCRHCCNSDRRYDYRPRPGTGVKNESNPNWKGNEVSYKVLHAWVARKLGKAAKCEYCSTTDGRIEWANKSHEYLRDLSDWLQLCKKCHVAFDRQESWGVATKLFPAIGAKR